MSGATFTSTASITFSANLAAGNIGGAGGAGGAGIAGHGGAGGTTGTGGLGAEAIGGNGGAAGFGGQGQGGGLFNNLGSTVLFKATKPSQPPAASLFANNRASGGTGGVGGNAGGGSGGSGGNAGTGKVGGSAEAVSGGNGGTGGAANQGSGGGLYNAGTASYIGITVNFTGNQAVSGIGGPGGLGGNATGQSGGTGDPGGNGGNAIGGTGGDRGEGGIGQGGGIEDTSSGTLVIAPRQGAKKGSKQAKATDVITSNQALSATAGAAGHGGTATPGVGGFLGGNPGTAVQGQPGAFDPLSVGVGGGAALFGTATIDNTSITGNHASTNFGNVEGTFNV